MAQIVINDGMIDFSGGVNSIKPTTIAGPQNPNGLARNQLAWLTNATCRGGGVTARTGWQYVCTVRDGSAIYQGGAMYRPITTADLPYLVLSIGGRIYQVRVDLPVPTITDIMATGDSNPINEPQAYFVQGEEFLIIQAGDNVTLPLFWDGAVLRRSNGPARVLGTTAANFTAPAVGGIVQVTLSSPYIGPVNQVVEINGKHYQVVSGNSLKQVVTMTNKGDFNTGRNYPAGERLHANSPYVTKTSSAVTYDGTYWNCSINPPVNFTAGFGFHSVIVNGVEVTLNTSASNVLKMSGITYGSPQSTQLLNSPIGSDVCRNTSGPPDFGALVSGFSAPPIGSTVQVLLDTVYSGAFGIPVKFYHFQIGVPISSPLYEITAAGYPPLPPNDILLINLDDTQGNVVAFPTSLTTTPELPAATTMDYYMGRIWYAQGRTYIAGDIVRGPSGTSPYGFRDSILKVTENPLAIGGDGFTIPAEAGNIRALRHTAELDTSLGQGQLYVFSAQSIYRLKVPVTRSEWIAANDATQPLQTVVQLSYGSVGDRCVVQANSDLFYQTLEPGVRSLQLSIRYFGQWGNVPISRNENRALRFNDRSMLHVASGINFDNRMLQTALPVQTPVGPAFQAILPLDFDLISTFEERLPPAWEGMYEGLDILQLFEGNFGGRQRAFAVVHSREDHSIQVWELTDFLRSDFNTFGETRIPWIVEMPSFNWDRAFELKQLLSAEIWVDRVYGTVDFILDYRPDGEQCWIEWNRWQICSARNSCEDVNNPICYPITPYAEGYRETMTMPLPQDGCLSPAGRPPSRAYQFQPRLRITGWCRLRGVLLKAGEVKRETYDADMQCPGVSPVFAFTPQATVSPGASQQVIESALPTVPTPGITTQTFPLAAAVNNGVDPAVCVHAFCGDVFMSAEALLGGNAKLSWNQPIEPGIVAALLLYRSTDNVTFELIQQFNNPPTDATAGAFTYTDPSVPALNYFYRMDGVSIFGDRWNYNTVSITRGYQLNVQGGSGGNVLTWNAPAF